MEFMPLTAGGTEFAMLPPHGDASAPTLLLLSGVGTETLTTEPYCRVGRLLHALGWNIVSLDLPCHGADCRVGEPTELAGWAARIKQGEDIVASFRQRVNDVVEHLLSAKIADPTRISAAGTSRGGFMAFHAAAGNPRLRAVAAFSPVTDLLALREFSGQEDNPLVRRLALALTVEALADRAAWVAIGNADTRVDTDQAVDFTRALTAASLARDLGGDITLQVVPVAGHASRPEWHDDAASWFQQTVVSTVRTVPEPGHPLAVPCTVYPPEGTTGRKPGLVIHLYGAGGSHTFYNLMRPAYEQLRRRLREAGYWVVVPELGPSHWMNARAVASLDAVIASMVANSEVDPGRVHLLGTSMGGGSALVYASQRPGVPRSVCALFPMTDFEAWVTEQPSYLEAITQAHGLDAANPGAALHALSPLNHIQDFAKIPIYLLHGDADATVPAHHSRDFAAAVHRAGGRVIYREMAGGGHDDEMATGWQDDIRQFILSTEAHTEDNYENH